MIKSYAKKCVLAIYGFALTVSGYQATASTVQDSKSTDSDATLTNALFHADVAKEEAMMGQILDNVAVGNFKKLAKDSLSLEAHDHSGT